MKRYLLAFRQLWDNVIGEVEEPEERPIPIEELKSIFDQSSMPSLSFYLLLTLSTLIASFGLILGNSATIIGAMIIAPLMNPILTLSYAIIALDKRLAKRALLTLITGIILVIFIAFFGTKLVGIRILSEQIILRIDPNLLDLGVAFASGSAASLAYARRSIATALPGVAIAVALVPPLCVVGIGLALGETGILDIGLYFSRQNQSLHIADGAFLLFLANLVGIILSASVTFLFQGYGNFQKSVVGASLTILILSLIVFPLSSQFQKLLLKNKVIESLSDFEQIYTTEKEWIDPLDLRDIYLDHQGQKIYIQLNVIAPINALSQRDVELAQEFISKKLRKAVSLQIHLFPFQILKGANR